MGDKINFNGRDIISIKDFSREEMEYVFKIAEAMETGMQKSTKILEGQILGTLFFEPSTRTRLSFEAAMKRLGGDVVGFSEATTTSVQKGETLADTIRTINNYVDLIVIRHSLEGSARLAADFSQVPVINAGSGAEEHPTQALLDLYTIFREKGKIDGLNIALIGDLRYGRTVHSLAYALSLYDINLFLISPEILKTRKEVIKSIRGKNKKIIEAEKLENYLPELDVLYVTRIQKERFTDLSEYEKVKNTYKITVDLLDNSKEDLIIMHPLPRVDEISPEIDRKKSAIYFKQAGYGLATRMALLALVLGAVK